MTREEEDRLGKAERDIYSRSYEEPDSNTRAEFEQSENEVRRRWSDGSPAGANSAPGSHTQRKKPTRVDSFFKMLLLASLGFFAIAVGIAAILFFSGALSVSGENVDITVQGLDSARAGEETTLDILVSNNNDALLKDVTLTIQYPQGARIAENPDNVVPREEEVIGEIQSGEQVRISRDLIFFGKEGDEIDLPISLEYQIENSNAALIKEIIHSVRLTEGLVSMTVSAPQEISADQPVEFELTISSNTDTVLRDVVVHARYPFGFQLERSDPSPIQDTDNVWRLGDVLPEEEYTINLTGVVRAATAEERTLTFRVGTTDGAQGHDIATEFSQTQQTVAIRQPPVQLTTLVNGSDEEVFASNLFSSVEARVEWFNSLDGRLSNVDISVVPSGNVFNRQAVDVSNDGFYRSATNEIIWNSNTTPSLTQISSGGRGGVGMTLRPFSVNRTTDERIVNPHINLAITLRGTQQTNQALPNEITAVQNRTIRFNTVIGMDAYPVYSDGPFQNTGPIPPEADESTTYTLVLNATNRFNDVAEAEFQARLPVYVEWAGQTTNDSVLSYDPSSRRVTWSVGELPKQSGYGRSAKQVAFQVRLTPSVNQTGSMPRLLTGSTLRGRDVYTGSTIEETIEDPTTSLHNDPTYSKDDGEVEN